MSIEKLRTAYIVAYRGYCDAWISAYDDVHNVSYADKKALTTDAGQRYLQTKLEYEEARLTLHQGGSDKESESE